MQAIEWKDEYSVGVGIIDEQHKHFVGILNRLYDTIQNDDQSLLPEILKDLTDYAVYHFNTEEKYFDQFKFSGSDEHKLEHKKLKEKVAGFLSRKDEDPLRVSYELLDFLEDWLVHHLAELDKKYTKCFKDHGLV
jgi:hemerythrin-like metal-binding protein